MLLLIDLDNTLIERTGAYKNWAAECVETHGAAASGAEWPASLPSDPLTSAGRV